MRQGSAHRRQIAWLGLALVVLVAVLSACTSYDVQQGLAATNARTQAFTQGHLNLALTDENQAKHQALSRQLLASPLNQQAAVDLMLVNSPAMQALLAQHWADAAQAAQSGRIANPVFTLEHIVTGGESELNRFLTFGLLDVLTLPQRATVADQRIEQQRIQLAFDVVDRVTQVRQAWVRAVAADQSLVYAHQVLDSAQASAELARRMEEIGNVNRVTRARQQAFWADATTQWASAQQNAVARREELVRLLGLDESQAQQLTLPARLPELPSQPLAAELVGQQASRERLDIQLAQSSWQAAAKAQGLNHVTSWTDVELSLEQGRVLNNNPGAAATTTSRNGAALGIRLPLLDWGDMRRDAMNAQTLAAANRLEATVRAAHSSLRERYAAYRSAYDISQHYRTNVLPLRQAIAEESLLRYNGMRIGVFELLADAREQSTAVVAAIQAAQQFWLADAALQAELIGRPVPFNPGANSSAIGSAVSGVASH